MDKRYILEFYREAGGLCPMDEFLDSLPQKHLTRVHAYLELLEDNGPDLQCPYADTVAGKIRELRPGFGRHEYRLFYFFCGRRAVLTHGFLKKTQRLPPNEIERALRRMEDWRARRSSDEY